MEVVLLQMQEHQVMESDNVTINGFPSSLQSKTMAAGLGLMVSSTGSSQTYTYHKLLAKEADVEQLSNDINDFAARYRVGSSNPTTDLDAGDLFFNTSTSKLLVYNATNSAWEEAQSVGNFFISTLSPAFDGSTQDFTITNAPSNAQQIILSINGVVQKPNSGTSTPSEGFALSGSTVKLAAAPASGSDYFAIVLGSTVNIGTPSNNTVTTAMIYKTDQLLQTYQTLLMIAGSKLQSLADLHQSTAGVIVKGDGSSDGYLQRLTVVRIVMRIKTKIPTMLFQLVYTSYTQGNTVAGSTAGNSFSGTDAEDNSLFGKNAGTNITTGDGNTGIGDRAVEDTTTGSGNTALGQQALSKNTTASHNTAAGFQSLLFNTTGANNVAVGKDALRANTTASNNTAVGTDALTANTTGIQNVAVGANALDANQTGGNNVAVGYNSLSASTGDDNTGVGLNALRKTTSGVQNTGIGNRCLEENTTASNNTGLGYQSIICKHNWNF